MKTVESVQVLIRWLSVLSVITFGFFPAAISQPAFKSLRENLGPAVNNTYDQIAPLWSASDGRLYFAQNSHPDGYYEIWYTAPDGQGNWMPTSGLGSLRSADIFNQTLFGAFAKDWFLINGRFPLVNGRHTYQKGFSWYKGGTSVFNPALALPLEIEGLEPMLTGGFANAFFHTGKKILLLSFARSEKRDLFVSFPVDTLQWPITRWRKPVPLPAGINTPFEESCPFLEESGRILYFSSNRPGGYGSDDIYVSYALSDDMLQWSAPANLGFEVNSNFSELYYTTYNNHPFAYFVSYKHSMGAGDIFRIRVPDTIPVPEPITRHTKPVSNQPAQTNIIKTDVSAVQPNDLPAIKPGQLPVHEYLPNNITLLLDKSVSMAQSNRIDLLRTAAQVLLNRLRYIDKVSLVTFGEKTNLAYATQSLRTPDSLVQIIRRLIPDEGETFLNDGLQKAMAQSLECYIEGGHNEILIITDGYFSISTRTADLLQRNPHIKITFVLVDAGRIETNIRDYITKQLPLATILTLTNNQKNEEILLNHIKKQSNITPNQSAETK